MSYKDKEETNPKIVLGPDYFNWGTINDCTIYKIKRFLLYIKQCPGYFTPPDIIGLNAPLNECDDIPDELWNNILIHEYLHYVLYKIGLTEPVLDELNHCSTDDLDNTGLGKYVGWGDVY